MDLYVVPFQPILAGIQTDELSPMERIFSFGETLATLRVMTGFSNLSMKAEVRNKSGG